MHLFEIIRKTPRPVVSLKTPASDAGYTLSNGLTGYLRGTPMQESATPGQAELADGTKPFVGFQARDSQAGGPTLGELILGLILEEHYMAGDYGTYEKADEVIAEGANFIDSSITTGTTVTTPCSFVGGKFSTLSSGQISEWTVAEQMTPMVAGNVRVRFVLTSGSIKA